MAEIHSKLNVSSESVRGELPLGTERNVVPLPAIGAEAGQQSSITDQRSQSTATELGQGTAKTPNISVQAIVRGAVDGRGEAIDYVFFKRPEQYAIYRAEDKVIVQFSDNSTDATEQIKSIAELLPLRNKLQYLARALYDATETRGSGLSGQRTDCYVVQVADAIRLGLEKRQDMGKEILQGAIENATLLIERRGRLCHIKAAAIAVLWSLVCLGVIALAVWALGRSLGWTLDNAIVGKVLVACCGGAVGALLSIAIGIRNRTVTIEADPTGNAVEAYVRICIGVISAVVVSLMLTSGLITLGLGTTQTNWELVLLIGFAGGFLERLVPDLLEKSAARMAPA